MSLLANGVYLEVTVLAKCVCVRVCLHVTVLANSVCVCVYSMYVFVCMSAYWPVCEHPICLLFLSSDVLNVVYFHKP